MARRERNDERAVTQDEVDESASSSGGAKAKVAGRDPGDAPTGARTPPAEDALADESISDDSLDEESLVGESLAGDSLAGDSLAGDSLAGDDPSAELEAANAPEAAELAKDRESTSAEVSDEELEREVAALLFASPEPLSESKLASLLDGTPQVRVRLALDALKQRLATSGLPWEVRSIAGGWQLYTSEALADTVGRLAKVRKDEKVSPAGLETLAIVAYRQPVTKGEIEAIRGVQVGPILRTLVDRGLVKVAGRSDDPGRPLLYGTTRKFLDSFGLGSLDDLPRDGELLRD
jgi:segregation and condensation protein B